MTPEPFDPYACSRLLRATGLTPSQIRRKMGLNRPGWITPSTSSVSAWMRQEGHAHPPTRPTDDLRMWLADALNIPRATLFAACAGVTTNGFGPRSATRDEAIAAWNDRPRERELAATVANERGDGPAPTDGWGWDSVDGCWVLGGNVSDVALVERWTSPTDERPYWTVATDADRSREVQYPTARAAMIAASAMVKP